MGDFIYKDLNNDKIIDEKDKAPILNTTIPQHFIISQEVSSIKALK